MVMPIRRTWHSCFHCGTPVERCPSQVVGRVFCSSRCRSLFMSGSNHPRWLGGRTSTHGYVRVLVSRGHRRLEHVLQAEAALGRKLRVGEVVHHVNRDRSKNINSNLVICQDSAYHSLLHALARVQAAGGRPFLDRICSACRQVKALTEFSTAPRNAFGRVYLCRSCATARQWARRHAVG